MLLEVSDLAVRYGAVTAVNGLSLSVRSGTLVGLIGPNGAGKTSAIDAITGFVPAGGHVVLGGQDITQVGAARRARLGLGRTWQSLELFDDLSVDENIEVSRKPVLGAGIRRKPGVANAIGDLVSADPLGYLGLEEYRSDLPRNLSLGVRKLVGVARALASKASVIAMDEPAAGLDSAESAQLGVKLRGLVNDGLGILLVDHDMNLVLDVCDDLYVVEFGTLIARASPKEVVQDPAVIRANLGTSGEDTHNEEVADGSTS